MVVIKVNYTNDAPIIKVNYDDAPIYISTTVDATYISLNYGAGDGSAVWGHITGTLSDQTDLQNALDAKVPYTGATANVDLGEYELKAGQVEFDQTPTGTTGVGVMRWNDQEGTLDLGLKGGNVTLQVGQEQVVRVVNKTGANLLESEFKAVRISGAQGQRLGVALAQANNDNNSADTIGLVTENIDNNQEGFITTMGTVREINTTGSVYGQTWADGDVLYLSPTTPGAITNVKPVAPQHIVVLGYVEYSHANHGKIYVKVMNGWELGELHDVDTTGATAGQVLKYNGTIWTPSSDLDTGITSLNGLTALTQTFAMGTSGTDFNISSATSTHTFNLPTASATNRGLVSSSDWSTFNAKIGGTLATGQVAFGSAANTIAGSNNLFWDNANIRLGINTNTPSYGLHIANRAAYIRPTNNSDDALHISNQGPIVFRGTDDAITSRFRGLASQFQFQDASFNIKSVISVSNGLTYFNNGGGNVIIGGTTDSGQRLQVQGDAFIKGSGNTSGTTALTVQNSDSANAFRILNNGQINLGNNASFPLIRTVTEASITTQAIGGTKVLFVSQDTETGSTPQFNFRSNTLTHTSGNLTFFGLVRDYTPTSGTGTVTTLLLTGSINQTGGANGITRGLYVNPTLTAAADWRSIEWSNNTGWGLYGAGTANNYLEGSLGIGTTTLTGFSLRVTKNMTGATTYVGVSNTGQIRQDVTTTADYFGTSASTQSSNFSLSLLRHFVARSTGTFANVTAGGSVGTQIGFLVDSNLTGATNNFGFYGDIPSGTNRWNLYMNGTANNYMAGSLGIGATNLGDRNLIVSKALTGNTNYFSISQNGFVQSDVTTQAVGFYNVVQTQAASFTLGVYNHFSADQGTIGASSVITTQAGFSASAALTGATNNYGFRGLLSSATGRWNLYMQGTAANYLNGNTIIGGSAVDGGYKLDVQGTGRFTGQVNIQTDSSQLILRRNTNTNDNVVIAYDGTLNAATIEASTTFVAWRPLILNPNNGSNVGIGITPTRKLDVNGTSRYLGEILINAAGGTSSQLLYLKNSTINSTTSSTQMIMFRDGNTGIAYGSMVKFSMKSYGAVISASKTQLDISMSDGATETDDTTPLSIRGTGIGINNTSPNVSAMLDIASTTKGFLPPRMTTTQKNAIATPAAGLIVFDTTLAKLCVYSGTTWETITSI